ncbi:MAG: hypothetical protein CMC11_01280 [Flavobacteriaceae bacterium]|nr:hypothetical protein [Flavobacteriaceae bacterium]
MLFLFLFAPITYSQESFSPIKDNNTQFIIDGIISDDEWNNAIEVDLDYEVNPGNNISPKEKTKVFIVYSDTHLYIGFKAYANPKEVRASIRSRDDLGMISDDFIVVAFDTYGDSRNNYLLLANAFGSQLDARAVNAITDEDRYDINFNVDFETKGNIVSDGFEIEFKIPFASLPFPNGNNQEWNFNFRRNSFRNGVPIELRSQPFDRTAPCQICQTTDKLILKDIKIEKRIEFLPYVAGNVTGKKETILDQINYEKFNPNLGLGINLDLSKNSTLELTLNPDFSQVEADVTQIDVNSSVALEYPERRPYFNRGTDIVQYTTGAFYSRSINNPLISTKLISQGKKERVFFLTALDQNSVYQIAGEDRSYLGQGDESFVNVLRYQRLINKNSRLGLLTTNRYYKNGGYGNLLGTDGWFLLSDKLRFTYEVFLNFNKEPNADWIDSNDNIFGRTVTLDNQTFTGKSINIQLYRNTEKWMSYLTYRDFSPNFQADVGFIVKNNRKWGTLYHAYQTFPNKPALQYFSIGTKADILYTYEDYLKTISIDGILSIKTLFNTEINFTHDRDVFKNFLGRDYRNLPSNRFQIRSSPNESLAINLNLTFGRDLAYNEENPEIGREFNFYFMPAIQLSNKLRISPSIRYARLRYMNNDNYYYKGSISRFSIRYQFNNFFNVRIVSEYNTFSERFFIQPLIQWNPNPSTVFYIGGNQNSLNDFNDNMYSIFRVDQTQIFLKFQYLIGL